MVVYLVRRVLWGLLVLFCAGLFTFLLAYVAPGDPARSIVGPNATAAAVEAVRHALGLDRPLPDQLLGYLGRLLQGDLGTSYHLNRPVLDTILERFPATFQLVVAGVGLALLIGIPLGIRSAMRPNGKSDRFGIITTSVVVAMPAFWIGYVLIYFLAFQPALLWKLKIFPIGTYEPWDLRYLFLPALTLALGLAAYYARLTRTTLLEELHQDYVRTAHAKGLTEFDAAWRHGFRNALRADPDPARSRPRIAARWRRRHREGLLVAGDRRPGPRLRDLGGPADADGDGPLRDPVHRGRQPHHRRRDRPARPARSADLSGR